MQKLIVIFILFCTSPICSIAQPKATPYDIFLDESQPDSLRFEAAATLRFNYLGHKADSLLWQADVMKKMMDKGKSVDWTGMWYFTMGRYYFVTARPDSARIMNESGIKILENKGGNPRVLSKLLAAQGRAESVIGNFDLAKSYYVRARLLLDPEVDIANLGKLYLFEGALEQEQGQFLPALFSLQESLKFAEKVEDFETQATALVNIGLIFTELGMEEEARKELLRSAKIFEQEGDNHSLATAQTFLIPTAMNLEEARSFYNAGIRIATAANLLEIQSNLHYELGMYFSRRQLLDSAMVHFTVAQDIALARKLEMQVATAKTQKGDILIKQGKIREGIAVLESVLPELKLLRVNSSLVTAYTALSLGYKQQGNTAQALDFLEKSVALSDSIKSKEISENVIRQYLDNIYQKEKAQIEAQNALTKLEAETQLHQQRLMMWGLTIIMLLLGGLAYTFFRNMKAKKAAAEQLQELNTRLQQEGENLAQSNKMLHNFALSVSHDILNNIDLILSNGNILVGSSRNSKTLGLYFDQTQRIGQQLKEYCVSLLQSARNYHQEHNSQTLHDPNPIVRQILERFAPLLDEKGFGVETSPLAPSRLPLSIVSQVFQNLITNAIRYAGDTPNPVLRIAAEGPSKWIIEDNGPGIPADLLGNLFKKGIPSERGQGIGLAQVHDMLQKFGADISAERSPLGGARFVVVL
jgi:signal transduction histidine kinase